MKDFILKKTKITIQTKQQMDKLDVSKQKYEEKRYKPRQNSQVNKKEKLDSCDNMCKPIKRKYKRKNRDKIKHKHNLRIFAVFCECVLVAVFYIIRSTAGSIVVDSMDQKTIKFSDYCPKIGACAAGSHILCSYYNPNSRFGVMCVDPEDIKMTTSFATYILQVLNAMRARLAQGIEVGKEKLPRAYGLKRLQWDLELASFAQLWADNCLRYISPCQATKRFYDPSAVVLDLKFKYPNWTHLLKDSKPGINNEKIYTYITSGLRYIFATKKTLTAAEVYRTGVKDVEYQKVVNSAVTHIGCGMSGFTKFQTWDREHIIKNFELVCFLSARLTAGNPLYRTSLPEPTDTQKCGCEPGYNEDEDCLCYEDDNHGMCGVNNEKCKPPVVLLPIVTYEDMPQMNVKRSNSDNYSSSITQRFNGLSTLWPKEQPKPKQIPSLFVPTKFDTSKRSFMKINIAPIKDLTGARGTMNKYLEKIRNGEETEDYSFTERPMNPAFDYIKTKLRNFNGTGGTVNLVSLLDKVEDEIRGLKLNGDALHMIEDKIKKIYGTVLGKNYNSLIENKVNDDDNLISSHNNPKTFTQDLIDFKDFGPVKSNTNYESIDDVVHRIKSMIVDTPNVGTQQKQTKINSLDILDDEDVLSDDRKKYYENKLHTLKNKKSQAKKTFLNGHNYILERPVQRLRPSHHTMQKEYKLYPEDILNSMDNDYLY